MHLASCVANIANLHHVAKSLYTYYTINVEIVHDFNIYFDFHGVLIIFFL